ncbi:MAG: cytochrome c [Sphingomonadales bacterium]|jgi:cytochrome c|nr:cytochrome c [Sphingomonadales bacterium]
MDNRFNTIAGWTLGAGIVFLGAWLVTGELFRSERPEPMGYPIAGVEQESEGGGASEQPIAFYLQTADAARGEGVFRKCAACHTAAAGAPAGLGPNLHGRMGARIASEAGYSYSEALRGHGGDSWGWDNMSAWLASPRAFAPGTKMTFAGLSDPQDRADVMVYLNSQGGNLQIPPPPAGNDQAAGGDGSDAPGENEARAADAPAQGDRGQPQPTPNAQSPGHSGGEAAPGGGQGGRPKAGGH